MNREPRRLAKINEIEIFCQRHWSPVLDSRLHLNPINGYAVTTFLLERFLQEIESEPTFLQYLSSGMSKDQATSNMLANLAPICCLYPDDSMQALREACRFNKLAKSHPDLNDLDDPEGKYHFHSNGGV